VVDAQDAPDAAQIHTLDIQLDGLLPHLRPIAMGLALWRVAALAVVALVALCTGRVAPVLHLLVTRLAVRTCAHAPSILILTVLATPRRSCDDLLYQWQ